MVVVVVFVVTLVRMYPSGVGDRSGVVRERRVEGWG